VIAERELFLEPSRGGTARKDMPKRTSGKTGSELFIVDNSDDEWKVVRYLRDWCSISSSIDVATAYFEVGSLLALDGEWQKVDHLRVLMGDEVSKRTKAAFAAAVVQRLARLDASIESEKEANDFVDGIPAIVDAIKSRKIELRVFRKEKFHAKAYITHARLDVVGSAALVGSSNFTRPGLTQNVELNVQITGQPVGVLQDWYEEQWEQGEDVSLEMLRTIERHVQEFLPFDVYAHSLRELFRDREYSASEWEKKHSVLFPTLDGYQREGYGRLLEIADSFGGAFLCDGVGLGKTFVGLMLLERLVRREKKNVVLLVPKSARESVWVANLRRYMPDLADGVFSGLAILNHTDLNRVGIEAQLEQIAERADAIIIDEAHNFRNPGIAGEGERRESRYRVLQRIATGKQVFMLTATPVNNSLLDLMHLIEVWSGDGTALKHPPLGLHSLRGHFRQLEKRLVEASGRGGDTLAGIDDDITSGAAQEIFSTDPVVQNLVVQRSRAYVKESQKREAKGTPAQFPVREDPKVAPYTYSDLQERLLDLVDQAFNKQKPLFSLAVYNPEEFRRKGHGEAADFDRGRLKQVVTLIRTSFLKRLESSTAAFAASCVNLFVKLLVFVERHATTSGDRKRLSQWKDRHAGVLAIIASARAGEEDDAEAGEDLISPEMLEADDALDNEVYDVAAIVNETYEDLTQLANLLETLREFTPADDSKLSALLALLRADPILRDQKVLIFTEFAVTARHIKKQLEAAGLTGVAQVDSSTKLDRGEVIKRFAPYYNRSNSAEVAPNETRILIATDVLSEGLNLQDATRLINYDLHWNPVRLMQRIGRVDRRMNPEIEAAIVRDHPDQAPLRGKVAYWNFLPPADLDRLLSLYSRVAGKTLRISKLFGIEGRKLLTEHDDFEDLKDFNASYEGTPSSEEALRLELADLLNADEKLVGRLDNFPNRIFSGREAVTARGVFFCWSLPVRIREAESSLGAAAWTAVPGDVRWYFRDSQSGEIAEDPSRIAELVRSTPNTPRSLKTVRTTLAEARDAVESHIRNGYLRQMQAPVGVKAILKAWMELN
jgi:superfamily II DNA or RNA helicase